MSLMTAEKLVAYTVVLHEISSHDELIPELPARLKGVLGASKVAMVIVGLSSEGTEISRVTHASGLGEWHAAETPADGAWVSYLLAEQRAARDAGQNVPAVRFAADGRVQALYVLNSDHAVAFDIQTAGAAFTLTDHGKNWLEAMLAQIARNLRARLNRPGVTTRQVSPLSELTRGEWRVLLAIDGDDQEKEIAEKLRLSTHTVHSHIKQVYRVMGVRSRMGAIAMLHRAERLALLQEILPTSLAMPATMREGGMKVRSGCAAMTEADGLPGWAKRVGTVEVSGSVRASRPFGRLAAKAGV